MPVDQAKIDALRKRVQNKKASGGAAAAVAAEKKKKSKASSTGLVAAVKGQTVGLRSAAVLAAGSDGTGQLVDLEGTTVTYNAAAGITIIEGVKTTATPFSAAFRETKNFELLLSDPQALKHLQAEMGAAGGADDSASAPATADIVPPADDDDDDDDDQDADAPTLTT